MVNEASPNLAINVRQARADEYPRGIALETLLESGKLGSLASFLKGRLALQRILSACIMFFEITFPLSVLDKRLAICYIAAGLAFHASIAVFMKLHFFLFVFPCAYPALRVACLPRIASSQVETLFLLKRPT